MRDLSIYLKNRLLDNSKLINYGFSYENDLYLYSSFILDRQFKLQIKISKEKQISKLIDCSSNDEYVMADIKDSSGEFVGKVKEEYENKLLEIINECTYSNVFKEEQSKKVIQYIKNKYNDELEFLWEKFDNCAIWRNKSNNKWYGVLLVIEEKKLGIDSKKLVEIIDLKYQKESISQIIDSKTILPGYHMNKKSWITIKLDHSLSTKKIFELIDNSYDLSSYSTSKSSVNKLSKRVLHYLTTIPKGKVVTYKQVAEYLGNPGLARIVGNILHKNPDGDKYPCYKVLNSKGMLAESFVFGGADIQRERLEKEGIEVINNRIDLNKYQWKS
ncbi:MAG: MGMT family protein [Clostridia bacterium]|nr:MGMT family protein [Clostridia bacterium]